jgi:hypothetical protein
LATAFQTGDVVKVVKLSLQNGMESATAFAIAYNHILKSMNAAKKENIDGTRQSLAA